MGRRDGLWVRGGRRHLRRQHRVTFIGEFRAGKQPQRIRLNSISLQTGVGHTLQGYRQFLRLLTQRFWQRSQRRLNFLQREFLQMFPVGFHVLDFDSCAPR